MALGGYAMKTRLILTACLIATVCLVLGFAFPGCTSNRILRELYSGFLPPNLTLLSRIYDWERDLGPATVLEDHGFPSYYYWPSKGIAVHTSGFFLAQRNRPDIANSLVTSIIIPCKRDIRAIPIPKRPQIHFDALCPIRIKNVTLDRLTEEHVRACYWFRWSDRRTESVEFFNFPIKVVVLEPTIVYKVNGEVEQLSISYINFLATYD